MLLKVKQILNSSHFPLSFSKAHFILPNHVGYVNSDPHLLPSQHLFTAVIVFLLHWNVFKRKGCKVGLICGKSNWGNLAAGATLSTGADYTLITSTYLSNWEKVCVSVCLCLNTHPSFHKVSLTSQTLVCKGLGSGCPHIGIVHGCSHRSVSPYTDVHLFHIRLYLQRTDSS